MEPEYEKLVERAFERLERGNTAMAGQRYTDKEIKYGYIAPFYCDVFLMTMVMMLLQMGGGGLLIGLTRATGDGTAGGIVLIVTAFFPGILVWQFFFGWVFSIFKVKTTLFSEEMREELRIFHSMN